ncbi:MAG: efflux RND transporter periplasmic adaptor subunit [Gammaproteobacteria bacterium]|nr:efflux RND transporter periplasmic adaptor subunit [Gammaproteobacteria bacterium]
MLRFRSIFIIAVIILLGTATVYWLQRNKPIPVQVYEVGRGEVERTVTNTRAGTLNACRRARLSPSLGGQIANLPAKEGESVKQGQLLFEIWNSDLHARVELAEAELIASKARRQEACIRAELANTEAQRLDKLQQQGLASDEEADKASSQARSTRAACEAAAATVSVSQAKLSLALASLEKTRLLAPFDGIIAEVNGELGEYVTPSPVGIPTPPAVDIIDTSCLYISAPIDEVDAPQIRPGMTSRISLDAFGREFFEGRVRRVAPYVLDIEKQARTVDIEVDFISAKDNSNMLPGYTADIEVILDAHGDSLRIPTEALLEGSMVYLYDSNLDTISKTRISTGLSNWRYTEVLEGLAAGQVIVTSIDREGLVDGAVVKIEKQ